MELNHFLDIIDGNAKPLISGDDCKRDLLLAEAAELSVRFGPAVGLQLKRWKAVVTLLACSLSSGQLVY